MQVSNTPPPDTRRYWLDALLPEVETIWGRHRRYGTDGELEDLAYYAAISSFYEDSFSDVQARRALLYYFLSVGMDTGPNDPLYVYSSVLPMDSWIPKVVKDIAIAYNTPPDLIFEGNAGEAYKKAAKEFGLFGRLQHAYRIAKLCSGSLVGPYVSGSGDRATPRVHVLPPDMFRYQVVPNDPDTLAEVVIPVTRIGEKGRPETFFQVWHDDRLHMENYKGDQVSYLSESGERVWEEPNRYRRIPYELMRLSEPANDRLLSGGLFPLVESNIACNGISFMADHNLMYNGFSQWVAYNLDWVKNKAKLSPASMLALENVKGGETGDAEGRLDVVSPPSQYDRIEDMKRSRKREAMRDLDIPESMISESPGTPPSGIARQIERLGLLAQRADDILQLSPFHRRFLPLVREVWNQDYRGGRGYVPLPDADLQDIVFHDEPVYGNPDTERKTRIWDVQVAVAEGRIQREMGLATATVVYGFTEAEAEKLFPIAKPLPVASGESSGSDPVGDMPSAVEEPISDSLQAPMIQPDEQPPLGR